jgi:hypothetical protein
MKSLKSGDESHVRLSEQTHIPERNGEKQSAVVGNERITALAGAVLLVLIVVELVSAAILRTLMPIHVFAGVLLAGPLIIKLGSTGWRFLRYYTRSPAYVRRGPPHLALRIMGPLLIAATLVVIGSGIGLVVTGPRSAGLLLPLHGFSVLVWLPLIAIHTFAHILRVPWLVADDWSKSSGKSFVAGRVGRLSVNIGALLAGVVAAILLFPGAAPWTVWSQANERVPAPMVVGLLIAILAILLTRPWRLAGNQQ